ncbi:MAG TPA: hypothetical protein VGI06_01160, partial [Acidimicrobiales bacterium]
MEPELLDAEDEEGPGASRRGLVLVPSNAALSGGDGWVIRADDLDGLRQTLAGERSRHDRERSPLAAAVDAAQRAVDSAEDRLQAAMAAAATAEEEVGALRERAAAWAAAEADLAAAKQVRTDAEAALLAAQADVADFEAARGAVEWALRDTRAGLERHRAVGGGGGLDGLDGLGDAGLMAEIARVEEVARRVAAERAEAQVTLDALRQGRAEAAKADQELTELVETHRARLAFLAVDEPVALRQAVAAYQQAAEGAPIDAAALSIAEQWAELDRRSDELAAGEPPPPTAAELQRARRRVNEANRMLADEMEAARLASLSDET